MGVLKTPIKIGVAESIPALDLTPQEAPQRVTPQEAPQRVPNPIGKPIGSKLGTTLNGLKSTPSGNPFAGENQGGATGTIETSVPGFKETKKFFDRANNQKKPQTTLSNKENEQKEKTNESPKEKVKAPSPEEEKEAAFLLELSKL